MDLDPKLSEWIRQKIIDFSSATSNEPEYRKELAEHFQVLPLLIDWTVFWGIRPDGRRSDGPDKRAVRRVGHRVLHQTPTQYTLSHTTIIAIVAAVITRAVAHPSHFNKGGLILSPITFLSLVSIVTNTISGGARTPFITAE